ncbi:MAG: formate dehydrogenase [Beijerinckiaceae bacterium]|nr:formate dehydrogenase [Beijerinckiaceae bacterium]MDO9443172.1 formate dehydrogenase [Beijerinckiaceae bacterium]
MKTGPSKPGRRSFLRAFGVASASAGLGAALLPAATVEAQAYDPGAEETKGRYRETEDVKAYYRTNGYETLTKK